MNKSKSFFVLCLPTLLALSGCGGINSRIKDNERQFATYPPEVQAQIQNGRIDRGFTEEQVFLAKGKPDEKTTATRDGKTYAVWKYARAQPSQPTTGARSSLSSPYGYPGFGPGPSQPTPMFYERTYFKIEFDKGRVVGWDQDLQEGLPDMDEKAPDIAPKDDPQ